MKDPPCTPIQNVNVEHFSNNYLKPRDIWMWLFENTGI